MRVSFYHLLHTTSFEALPQLLEKTLSIEKKALVLVENKQLVKELDTYLWSYVPASKKDNTASSVDPLISWLPHCTDSDKDLLSYSPFIISCDKSKLAQYLGDYIFQINTFVDIEVLGKFERILFLFSGRSQDEVEQARALWRDLQERKMELNYFKQEVNGKWSSNT